MADQKSSWRVNVPIKKTYEKKVFGWASVIESPDGTALVDQQGDVISEAELEDAAYHYVSYSRQVGDMHQQIGVAKLIESFVVTKAKRELLGVDLPLGWWVGFEVCDAHVFARIVSGELTMMSIGGYAETHEIEASAKPMDMSSMEGYGKATD